MSKYTIHRTGCGHIRRIERDGKVIGMASQTTNGKWFACDANEHALMATTFATPTQVKNWFRDNDK